MEGTHWNITIQGTGEPTLLKELTRDFIKELELYGNENIHANVEVTSYSTVVPYSDRGRDE